MEHGLISGLFWATDTVLIHRAFMNDSVASILPLVIACIHDCISVVVITIMFFMTKNIKHVIQDIRSKGAKYIALAALLGGPIGLSSYILAIHYLGPYFVTIITSLYPALGTLFATIFLGERRKIYQWLALGVSIISVMLLGMQYEGTIQNIWIGFTAAIICAISWGLEAVICSWTLHAYEIKDTSALWIRQCSAMLMGFCIITSMIVLKVVPLDILPIVYDKLDWLTLAAVCGALSYFCYYSSIHRIGASRAMALNSSYSGFSILITFLLWHVYPTYQEIILGFLIVGGGIISAYDYKE